MPEGLKLIVSADVKQAEKNLQSFVTTAGKEGNRAASALTTGLNKALPAANKTFTQMSTGAKAAIKPISLLGDSIETLRAKLLARKEFLITTNDIGKIKLYNSEIKALEAEILRLQAVGTSSMGAIGKAGTKAFSFLRSAAQILPGIGIAGIFGAVFSGISSLFDSIGGKSDELKKKLAELIVPIQNIKEAATAGTAEELAKVNALSNAVLNQSLSYKERNAALNQLKEINNGYFGDLTVETAALGLLKTRVDEYTAAIINAAIIKAFSDDIGKLAVELSKQEKAFNQAGKAVDANKKKLNDPAFKDAGKRTEQTARSETALKVALGQSNNAFTAQAKVVGSLRDKMFELRGAIQEAVNEGLKFKPLDKKTIEPPNIKSEVEFIPRFDLKPLQDLLTKPGFFTVRDLNIQGIIIPELHVKKTDGEKLHDKLKEQISSTAAIKPIPIPVELLLDAQLLEKQMKDINSIMGQGFADLFAGIGEGLADSSLGQNITRILGGIIQQIGKALIQYGIVKEGLDKILKGGIKIPGVLAIGLGIAAVAIGQLIKNAKPEGFAKGGLVFGPTFGMVGEGSGTSRSNPEVIAPLDKLQALLGGVSGNQVVVLKTVISGNNLALVDARTARSQKRLGIA